MWHDCHACAQRCRRSLFAERPWQSARRVKLRINAGVLGLFESPRVLDRVADGC